MNRELLDKYINETFHCPADYPWAQYPECAVYRHQDNKKWFAVVLDVHKSKLNLADDEIVYILNLKCNPILIEDLLREPGFFPAYHMNKKHWLTIILDGTVKEEYVQKLVAMSFEATKKKK